MEISKINRSGNETIDRIVVNVDADSITKAMLVNLAIGGNSFDAVNAVKAASGTTANLPGFIGVSLQDYAANDPGLVRSYGFVASMLISNEDSVTINQGDPICPGALAGGGTSLAPTYAASGFGYILASNVPLAVSADPTYISGMVRCI